MENPLLALEKAALSSRQVVRDFVQLFAIESRLASHAAIRVTVFGVLSGTLLAIAWMLLWMALAGHLVNAYDWTWPQALCLVAAVHVAAAAVLALLSRHAAKEPFFPRTLAQLHGATHGHPHGHHPSGESHRPATLRAELAAHERSLQQAKLDVDAQLTHCKAVAKKQLAHPVVLAGALGLGAVLGMAVGKSKKVPSQAARRHGRPISGELLGQFRRAAMAQVSAHGVSMLMNFLQRRQAERNARAVGEARAATSRDAEDWRVGAERERRALRRVR
ncbi:MAG TPA: phage holin family protein [Burkholderiales bacterium]|nr:phage holin family protein [Burkholderiales bacterium]